MLDNKETTNNNKVISLEKTVMELLEFKVKSEAKFVSLQQEVNSLKPNKSNENTNKYVKLTEKHELRQEFVKLKSEFELLKLCQRNNNTKFFGNNVSVTGSNCRKCNVCDLVFKTESCLKVHNGLVLQKENVSTEDLKYKHCNITCSD